MAIDYGARRVGVALSDEGGSFASPYDVLSVRSPQHAAELVGGICAKEGVRRIVLGLPLNMDGSIGPAAKAVISWGRCLAARSGLAVLFVDERLSSFSAEQRLVDRKRAGEQITRMQKKQRLDALAAAGFLQEFLDGKLKATRDDELP